MNDDTRSPLPIAYGITFLRQILTNHDSSLVDTVKEMFRLEHSEIAFPYLYYAFMLHKDATVKQLNEIVDGYIHWANLNCETGSVLFYTPKSSTITATRLDMADRSGPFKGRNKSYSFSTSVEFKELEMLTAFRLTFGL